jgi:hypothetical protein
MNSSGKHTSLLPYGSNYCRKKFYSAGPSGLVTIKVLTDVIICSCNKLECFATASLIWYDLVLHILDWTRVK